MKKILSILVVFLMLLSIVSTLDAGQKRFGIYANFGILISDDFSFDPYLWYFGGNVDLYISENIIISPEVNLISEKFKFESFILEPAVLLNFKLSSLFFGGGIYKPFIINDGNEIDNSSDLGLKLNAGFRNNNVKLTFFTRMAFDSLFKDMLIGVQLGIGF